MKTLIFSDVHGNLPAFEKMLDEVGVCDSYISLGDLVDFGPWSNECVDLALSLPNNIQIMGNHEQDYINGYHSGTNKLADCFFETTYSSFKRFDEISSFQDNFKFCKYICQHTLNNENIYPDTKISLDNNYLIGHSHHQFYYKNNGFELYNSGSVGQNRKYINICNYLIFDSDKDFMELHELQYDIDIVIQEMRSQNYPQACINYYCEKQRKA